jgi:hypothetical protein
MKIKIGEREYSTPFKYNPNSGYVVDNSEQQVCDLAISPASHFDEVGQFIVSALNNREGWNKVSDGLPTEYGSYLVQCDNGKMRVCGYFGNKENPEPRFYFPYSEHGHESVIAWRNLPNNYTE